MQNKPDLPSSHLSLETLLDIEEAKKITIKLMKDDYENTWNQADTVGRKEIEEITKKRRDALEDMYKEEINSLDDETIDYLMALFVRKEKGYTDYKTLYTKSQNDIDPKDNAYIFAQKNIEQEEQLIQEIIKARNCLKALIESIQIQRIKESGEGDLIKNLTLGDSHQLIIERMAKGV